MKKVIIIIPVYNDWESLLKLIDEINDQIKNLDFEFECLIINDCSTIKKPNFRVPKNIKLMKILNMKKNKGHARCNAFGIRYVIEKEKFDYLMLMDGDGEDRPSEIKSLMNSISINPEISVVAKRVKRAEGLLFQFLYQTHKLITYLFTGNNVNFGNYSCLIKKDVEILFNKASLWSSYSGTVKKNLQNLNEINSIRGLRYFGPSKMSLYKLIIHSFSIIAVFKYKVLVRSILFIIFFSMITSMIGKISIFFQILLIIFTCIIFIISLRENKSALTNSLNNLDSTEVVKHQ